jgi:hypothetical protein
VRDVEIFANVHGDAVHADLDRVVRARSARQLDRHERRWRCQRAQPLLRRAI